MNSTPQSQPKPGFLHRLRTFLSRLRKFFWRRKKPAPVPVADEAKHLTAWKEACAISEAWIASSQNNPDLALLIEDRMDTLRDSWPTEDKTDQVRSFALAAADFYDELGWLPAEPSAECATQDKAKLRTAISKTLTALGVELIHRTEWDATVQRAISIERTVEPLATPKILRFGRTGLAIAGELLRKQEVVILSN